MVMRRLVLLLSAAFALCLAGGVCADSNPAAAPAGARPPFEYTVTKINVLNLDESVAFYAQFFGYREVLRTKPSPSGMVQVYTTRGGENFRDGLTFVHDPGRTGPLERGALNTLVFSVTDIADVVRRIEAAGYKITRAPFETRGYPTPVTSAAVIAYAADPSGYPVEIVEWKP